MSVRTEPWYIHAVLYAVIIALVYVLIRVAIIEPQQVIERQNYIRTESRLRMENLREAEILWEDKYGSFTDNLDSLVHFIKTDTMVANVVAGYDSIAQRSTNPFAILSHGEFSPESLFTYPGNGLRYLLGVDTSISIDTVINRRGSIVNIDTVITIGTRYVLETPDSNDRDKIGDIYSDALKNSASWE